MCGIAGAFWWEESSAASEASVIVSRMVEALAHRGPDGRGVVRCESVSAVPERRSVVAFGHARLAVLDLSERAAQPMRSEHAPVWITYNGEVYNFESIRRDLEACGRHFRSRSDTEVILQGYAEWGEGILDRLRGMFAIAIWDGERDQLLLARDRLGIKPLYVYRGEGCLLFASEVGALLATKLVPRRLDLVAIDEFLAYQTVPPPRTLVDKVRMIQPGQSVIVRGPGGEWEDRIYWDLLGDASAAAGTATSAIAQMEVGRLLAESTSLHLVSDVPVAIFLSGGIDSSAIVALTRQAGRKPRTFSVVMPGTDQDEAIFAGTIARKFDAEHTQVELTDRDLRNRLPQALASVDHPSGDGLNTFVISQAVRRAGFKVALSGLGGDELFGGYPSFDRLSRFAKYAPAWKYAPAALRQVAAVAVRVFGRSSVASKKAAAILEADGSLSQTFPVMRQLFTSHERRSLLGHSLVDAADIQGDPYVRVLDRAIHHYGSDAGLMSLISYAEARTYMHDVLLRDTDQMGMAHGLEIRVPLLDHRLVEYVMGLPDAVKLPGTVPKRLLVESLGAVLPAECVERPKQGFVLPFDQWMKGELREFCEQHLGPDGFAGRDFVRAGAVEALWRAFLDGDGTTTWSRPWALVALNAWIEQNGMTA